MVDESTIADWAREGLPSDELSVQNGIMVTRSSKWPLLIDPQGQGLGWIKRRDEVNQLRVTELTDKRFRNALEDAMAFGQPLLIQASARPRVQHATCRFRCSRRARRPPCPSRPSRALPTLRVGCGSAACGRLRPAPPKLTTMHDRRMLRRSSTRSSTRYLTSSCNGRAVAGRSSSPTRSASMRRRSACT